MKETENIWVHVNEDEIGIMDKQFIKSLQGPADRSDVEAIIHSHLSMVLSLPHHPICQQTAFTEWCVMWFIPYEDVETPSPTLVQEIASQLLGVSELIQEAVKQHYDFMKNNDPIYHGYCVRAINLIIWNVVYEKVFRLLQTIYRNEDSEVSEKIFRLRNKTVSDFKIPRTLWLTDDVPPPEQDVYTDAIVILQEITVGITVDGKLKALLDAKNSILKCVNNHRENKPTQKKKKKTKKLEERNGGVEEETSDSDPTLFVLGADDMLPLLMYVVLKAQVPHIFVEMKFIESFADEERMIGEDGWMLAALHSVINLLKDFEE